MNSSQRNDLCLYSIWLLVVLAARVSGTSRPRLKVLRKAAVTCGELSELLYVACCGLRTAT